MASLLSRNASLVNPRSSRTEIERSIAALSSGRSGSEVKISEKWNAATAPMHTAMQITIRRSTPGRVDTASTVRRSLFEQRAIRIGRKVDETAISALGCHLVLSYGRGRPDN